jgi:hypothetical protein
VLVPPGTEVEIQLSKYGEKSLGFRPIEFTIIFLRSEAIDSEYQIVAKARQKGYFSPRINIRKSDNFRNGLLLTSENKNVSEETISGKVPLLPIQHWFFEET